PVLPVPCHPPPRGRRAGCDHPAGTGGLPVLAAHRGILGGHPGAVAVDDPGVPQSLPPPQLAPGLTAGAAIYVEELPFHHDEIARFIPGYVMTQLESGEALAKIPHPRA